MRWKEGWRPNTNFRQKANKSNERPPEEMYQDIIVFQEEGNVSLFINLNYKVFVSIRVNKLSMCFFVFSLCRSYKLFNSQCIRYELAGQYVPVCQVRNQKLVSQKANRFTNIYTSPSHGWISYKRHVWLYAGPFEAGTIRDDVEWLVCKLDTPERKNSISTLVHTGTRSKIRQVMQYSRENCNAIRQNIWQKENENLALLATPSRTIFK